MLIGGLLVVAVGYFMLRRKPIESVKVADTTSAKAIQYALQAAGCALANPGALAYMFGLVAIFKLDIGTAVSPVWLIVLCVLLGALIWWFSLAYAADKLRERFEVKTLNRVNKIAGYAVVVFGMVLLVRSFFLF